MTSEGNYLTNIKPYSKSCVTFGDGARGKTVGKGHLNYLGVPCLNDVLLFNDLTTNLISTRKLCRQELSIIFTSKQCIFTDEQNTQLMKGSRYINNCYMWPPSDGNPDQSNLTSKVVKTKLWHKKLGHLNIKSM